MSGCNTKIVDQAVQRLNLLSMLCQSPDKAECLCQKATSRKSLSKKQETKFPVKVAQPTAVEGETVVCAINEIHLPFPVQLSPCPQYM